MGTGGLFAFNTLFSKIWAEIIHTILAAVDSVCIVNTRAYGSQLASRNAGGDKMTSKSEYRDAIAAHMRRNHDGGTEIVHLVCDREGFWVHNPSTGADAVVTDGWGNAVHDYYTAAVFAMHLYPRADIRLLS